MCGGGIYPADGKEPSDSHGLLGETLGRSEGTFMFILNIILYQLIKSEFLIGCNFADGACVDPVLLVHEPYLPAG